MNRGRLVFSQLMEFVPIKKFRQCVKRYNGDHRTRKFTCWDQLLCMAFAQLTYRESLRDIEVCLRTKSKKLYHLGMRGKISRSTLADANDKRDWRIYQDFVMVLIQESRDLYSKDVFSVRLKRAIYAFDSTIIDLCLSLFPWAKYRSTKASVKLHTLLDLRGSIPSVIVISRGNLHDENILSIKKRLQLQQSLYTILQILSVSIFKKTPILQLFRDVDDLDEGLDNPNQLKLF